MKLALLILSYVINATGFCSDSGEWTPTGEKEGVVTYKKLIPGTNLLAFKGSGEISAPIEKIATVIFDAKRAPEWVPDLEKAMIVRWLNPREFIEYDHISTPPVIMKDREFLSLIKVSVDSVKKTLLFEYKKIEDPEILEDKNIRGSLDGTRFFLESKNHGATTYVSGEIHCDPKGSVPQWLVNHFQESWPHEIFRRLRKQLSKPDIQVEQKFADLFKSSQ